MIKRPMVRQFLEDAFAGESKAHMKYLIFAENAEKNGSINLAKMWKAIAHAEFTHARNHFKALGYLGTNKENLKSSLEGENFEIEEMYPAYNVVSELQNEKEALKSIHFAIEAEKIHSSMYEKAIEKIENNTDLGEKEIYICNVCGYTTEGSLPEKCPVCGAGKDNFVQF